MLGYYSFSTSWCVSVASSPFRPTVCGATVCAVCKEPLRTNGFALYWSAISKGKRATRALHTSCSLLFLVLFPSFSHCLELGWHSLRLLRNWSLCCWHSLLLFRSLLHFCASSSDSPHCHSFLGIVLQLLPLSCTCSIS